MPIIRRRPEARSAERAQEATNAAFPVVDDQASQTVAAWTGASVALNRFYKPFLDSILAQTEDELKALRDVEFVQKELDRAHLKKDAYVRRLKYLEEELQMKMLPEDMHQVKKCKKNFILC